MTKLISRRGLFQTAFPVAAAGVVLGSSARAFAADAVCADPAKMDDGQKSLRTSLNYVEIFSDASKTCKDCGFFAATAGGCGTCQIFSGPANPNGHCDSWGAKG
jgi:hypothetical protein